MTTIRQEINIINLSATGTGTVSANGIVQLDTTQYVNPKYYFEAVISGAASNTGTVVLTRNATTTNDATLTGVTSATKTRVRSAAFTPPAGQTAYFVRLIGDGTRSQTVLAARIIVIDGPATLTSSETQLEVGGNGDTYTSTTAVALTNPKYWLYTSANWDGTKTFYAEVVYKTAATNTATITLQEDSGGTFASFADKVTIVNAVSNTTATRARSASFVPTAGRNYRIAVKSSTTKSTVTVYNAKVIVDQVGYWNINGTTYASKSFAVNAQVTSLRGVGFSNDGAKMYAIDTATKIYQYTLSTPWDVSTASYATKSLDFSANDNSNVGNIPFSSDGLKCYINGNQHSTVYQYTLSTAWDISSASYASKSFSFSTQDIRNSGITFSTDGKTMYMLGNTGKVLYQYTLSTAWDVSTATYASKSFSPTGLSSNNLYGIQMSNDGLRVYFNVQTGTSKINQYKLTTAWDISTAVDTAVSLDISGQDSAAFGVSYIDGNHLYMAGTTTNPTVYEYTTVSMSLLEPQYLLLNTADSGSTGLQSYQTLQDDHTTGISIYPTDDWAGMANTYKYAHDATNASDASKLVDIDNANTDVSGATVTGANQQISATFTLPTAGHQVDVNVTNTTGVVGASRIIVQASTAGTGAIFDSVTVAENVQMQLVNFINVFDSVNVSESVTAAISTSNVLSINVFDSITVAETVTTNMPILINVFDSVTVAETITPMLVNTINVFDSVTVAENTQMRLVNTINVFDSVNVSETITPMEAYQPQVFDLVNVSENVTPQLVNLINVFDSITISENIVSQVPLEFINVFDSVTVAETVIFQLVNFINVFDSITIAETVTLQLVNFINVFDSITETDGIFYYGDSVGVSESDTPMEVLFINVFDSITVAETVTSFEPPMISVFDSVTVAENVQTQLVNMINIFDNVTIAETIITALQLYPTLIFDSVTVAENVQMQLVNFINVFDSVTVAENTQMQQANKINVSDNITAAETITPMEAYQPQVFDLVNVSENIVADVPAEFESIFDNIAVSEVVTPQLINNISVFDSVTVAENVTSREIYQLSVFDAINVIESSGSTLAASYNGGSNGGANLGDGTTTGIGMGLLGNGGNLQKVTFSIDKFSGSPTGNAVAKVYAMSGSYGNNPLPTGPVLATSGTIDVSTMPSSYTSTDFTFTGVNQITLLNSIGYVVTVEYSGGNASNYLAVAHNYHSGTPGNESALNGTWQTYYNGADAVFFLYTDIGIIVEIIDNLNVFDSVTVAENTALMETYQPQVFDNVTIAETTTSSLVNTINVFDSITVAETTTVFMSSNAFAVNVFDSINVSEATTLMEVYQPQVFDSITVAEVITSMLVNFISVIDNITAAETTTPREVYMPQIFDNVTVAETATLMEVYKINVFDSITVQDVLTDSEIFDISVFDNITVAETTTLMERFQPQVFDNITVAETTTLMEVYQTSVFDNVTVAETATILLPYGQASVFDNITVAEVVTPRLVNNILVFDSINIVDVVIEEDILDISVEDDITVSDNIALSEIYNISVFDSVTVAETFLLNPQVYVSLFDSVIVTENIQMILALATWSINVFDSITIQDVVIEEDVLEINVFDNVTASDVIFNIMFNKLLISVYDVIGGGPYRFIWIDGRLAMRIAGNQYIFV